MTATQTPVAASIRPRPKIISYLRLAKARVYHYAYGWALGLLLLRSDGFLSGGTLLAMAFMLVGTLAIQWSASAADDVSGFLNGSDARNYVGRPLVTMVRKPLLTGALALPEAVRFAVAAWIGGMLAISLAAGVLDWRVPLPALVVAFGVPALAVQYSCGIKVSYRPLGLESTIFFTGVCTVLVPYWFAAGTVSRETLLMSALFGLWLLLVVSYGNASDRAGDAAVSRKTLAVVLPPMAFAVVLHVLVAVNAVLLVLLFTTTRLNAGFIVLSAPAVALQLAQLYYGVYRRELRKARFLVLISIDLGFLGLATALLTGRPS
ncbi:UbiA family prenyltransferase [Streptomyces sp. NBC_00047]|uniref:UbiA family prenyltransferase n=1 Tax=Streptomyces sp. NBC_00047 TaxID=2975627 RepID=UPI00225228F7|nr:UbiA family prenyltransferase [Streptomyces sp. NBC_00047]MCX5612524.1 UbiA family prenyltransferase [Streptomyces sp. NBC_00047]